MDASVPSRILPFSDLFNFRDVGGYAGLDGRRVRWRRLFRSDSLHRLRGEDQIAFDGLGVRTVIDLRRPHEIVRIGRVPGFAASGYHNVYPDHATWDDVPFQEDDDVARWLADRYNDLAIQGRQGVAGAIALIADRCAEPLVVHCLAGKDRTGVVCALTLSLLGVSDTDIAEDYSLSELGTERFSAWLRQADPVSASTMIAPESAAPAEAMAAFLGELRQRYGSIERYLTGAGLCHDRIVGLRTTLLT